MFSYPLYSGIADQYFNLDGSENIDFGFVKVGTINEKILWFQIGANDLLEISKINIKSGSSSVFNLTLPESLPVTIGTGDKIKVILDCSPKFGGNFNDTLIFSGTNPYEFSFQFPLSCSSIALTNVWAIDTAGMIGDSGFRLPIKLISKNIDQDVEGLSCLIDLEFEADVFYFDHVSRGIVKTDNVTNGIRRLTISVDDVTLKPTEDVITYLEGYLLFSDKDFTKVKINNINWDNDWISSVLSDGGINLIKTCRMNLGLSRIIGASNVIIEPNPVEENVNIVLDTDLPENIITIATIEGKIIDKFIITGSKDDYRRVTFPLDITKYCNGMYFLTMTNVHQNVTLPMQVIK
jgi:hypothetical protein